MAEMDSAQLQACQTAAAASPGMNATLQMLTALAQINAQNRTSGNIDVAQQVWSSARAAGEQAQPLLAARHDAVLEDAAPSDVQESEMIENATSDLQRTDTEEQDEEDEDEEDNTLGETMDGDDEDDDIGTVGETISSSTRPVFISGSSRYQPRSNNIGSAASEPKRVREWGEHGAGSSGSKHVPLANSTDGSIPTTAENRKETWLSKKSIPAALVEEGEVDARGKGQRRPMPLVAGSSASQTRSIGSQDRTGRDGTTVSVFSPATPIIEDAGESRAGRLVELLERERVSCPSKKEPKRHTCLSLEQNHRRIARGKACAPALPPGDPSSWLAGDSRSATSSGDPGPS
ncbi:unnamed protein product, partial [Amoebophrya sp. A25]|eukprot:GSA25T00013562001.1